MRVLLQVLIALAFVAGGVVFGALNPQYVTLDFHLFHLIASLGVALLVALLTGALLGGLAVTVGVVWSLQQRLRKARRELAVSAPASTTKASRSA
ncbi:MAG: lipopolysaccharide assembly protein LapA domain-containing protein [Lysobacteraceae bacterium]